MHLPCDHRSLNNFGLCYYKDTIDAILAPSAPPFVISGACGATFLLPWRLRRQALFHSGACGAEIFFTWAVTQVRGGLQISEGGGGPSEN